ncbi:aspartyl protease family protein [Vibrio nigripulchritudo]|uniref:aspartyl protease family protein n=1 Tax=Vibrio nigripulchritudo TaxID=28173 RepID=UPI0005FA3EFD|nr:aspartyl protease family protein [Vibrio nigripulchritudo]KJY78817.1 hypothetical protein TW74_12340 [Vibrio nigripulchritudo]
MKKLTIMFISVVILLGCTSNTQQSGLSEVLLTKPYTETKDFHSVIPILTIGNKILLYASINGKRYSFIMDTGAPTILTKEVADELGIEAMGTNKGRDANNNLVSMDISIADSIEIGDVAFRNVPVFIFDPSGLPSAKCFLDGGIIGAEILPLAAWQLNFKDSEIVITSDVRKLDYTKGAARAILKESGYPHHPILEHRINDKFTDNLMFDTGNTEVLQLNQLALDQMITDGVLSNPKIEGHGSFGESAGGQAESTVYYQTPIESMEVGGLELKDFHAWTRATPPSLLGAKLLENHIVTLDYPNRDAYFYKFQERRKERTSWGYKTAISELNSLYVSFLESPSLAESAGLQLGDRILKVNYRDTTYIDPEKHCEILRWLPNARDGETLELKVLRGNAHEIIKMER